MAAKVDELQKQIGQLEEKLKKVRTSKAEGEGQLKALQGKRKEFVLQSCLKDDAEAKKSRSQTDSEIAAIERDLCAYGEAIHEISSEIEQRKDDLAQAEWEAERQSVRKMVAAYLKSDKPARVKELVKELRSLLTALTEEENKVSNAIHEFEPRRMFGEGINSAKWRFERVCADLNHGGWEFYRWHGVPDIERGYSSEQSERVLEAIDQLEA